MEVIKVIQINTTCNWGSTGHIAEGIGNAIINTGGKNYILYGRYGNPSNSYAYKYNKKIDFYYHILQTRLFDRHGLASNIATRKIIDAIRQLKPNIIHLHNIHGYYLNYKILFKFLSETNIPIVWTLHDCWSYTGHCAYYSYIKCERWKIGCHNCPQTTSYPSTWCFDRSENNYLDKKYFFTSVKNMTIVPVSNWLANELKSSFLNKYPIKVIHNGINLDIFCPQKIHKKDFGVDDKFVILGVASNWEKRKGLNDFIYLRTLLPSEFIIILIGLSESQIKKMPKGIIGIRRTNNVQELAKYYSVSDVYINFSVEETFGMTTCESLACGTPIIVYNSTACPEIVSKDTGFIIEPGDFESVIDAIQKIKILGKNKYQNICRQRAVQHFNKEDKYIEYINLYNQLIKG